MADSQAPLDLAASKAELEAVLASRRFTRAPAVSKILAYVCHKSLDGAGETVNEWSIAVDALGRRQSFDPEKDSIVRVEFHLLRKRLAEFYQKEGSSHAVRISFSDGGYIPRFVAVAPAAPEVPVQTAASWRTPGILSLAAIAVVWAAVVMWRSPANRAAAPEPIAVPGLAADGSIRILAGLATPKYVDSSGQVWLGDPYVSGGEPFDRPDRQIFRTLDQVLYQKGREGDLRYDIPAPPGTYELRLHFAETRFGQTPLQGAESMRRFDVLLNGRPILEDFDIARDAAGANTATVKVWNDVKPDAHGLVRLRFASRLGRPLVNAVELLPATTGTPLPIRLVCGMHPVYDKLGRFWRADEYFLGGRHSERQSVYEGADDLALYGCARFGNFSYAIPVAAGQTYRATFRFADYNSRRPGERIFDLLCNGIPQLNDFDILRHAGGSNRGTQVTLRRLQPNAQGKLLFTFVPSRDYAAVHAIEVESERN